jgi:transglutaminase-like putative cysteine protease
VALTAAIATAAAALCAVAAIGLPLPLAFGAALVPGVVLVATRPDRRPPSWFDVRRLAGLTAAAAFVVYVSGRASSPTGVVGVAGLGLVAVPVLSLLWPDLSTLRYCLLLSAAALAASAVSGASVRAWPVAAFAAAAAVALVATNRMSATTVRARVAPARSRARSTRRRVAGEAGVLLALAGLAGVLAAALLPPPHTANRPRAGRRPSSRPGAQAPYLQPTPRLDAGGRGSGKGNEIVFRVSAPGPALWRTETFGTWDGRVWRRAPEVDGGAQSEDGRFVFVPLGPGDERDSAADRFDQRVTIETGAVGLLPAAARPSTAQLPGGEARAASDGTVVATPALGQRSTLTITSFLPPADPAVLRATPGESSAVPADVARLYLGFPALPERVPGLAGQIAAGAAASYDKAAAVEAWLKANTQVAAGTAPLPAGTDPIDHFLATRRGSSEQAATAMAVMLRALGVPTRLAVGYLPGQQSLFGGDFVVRARDAYAWVEVWIPGAGWVAFDPAGRAPAPSTRTAFLTRLRHLLGRLWWVLVVIATVALAWVVVTLIRRGRRRRARPWVTRWYERLVRAGAGRGRPRDPAETPAEYCQALAEDLPDDRLRRVGELLTLAAYSPDEPPGDARAWAEAVVRDLERSPRARGRAPSANRAPG